MPDRGNNGGGGAGSCADHRLLGKGEEILDGTASARDDDDLDILSRVEFAKGPRHFSEATLPLDGDFADLEARGWPAGLSVDEDIVLRFRIAPADQADRARQEGEGLLPLPREEPLLGEATAHHLDSGEQIAQTLDNDFLRAQVQSAATLPEHGLNAGHDSRTLDKCRS